MEGRGLEAGKRDERTDMDWEGDDAWVRQRLRRVLLLPEYNGGLTVAELGRCRKRGRG